VLRRLLHNLVDLWRFVVDVALRWYHGGVGDLAAGVTFWILVSLPASILALLSVLSVLETFIDASFSIQIENNVLGFVARVFSDDDIKATVADLFDQNPNSGLLTVSLAVTLWSVSRGFAGLIRALDDIYDVIDSRPWYHTRVVAVVLGVGSLLISVPLVILERLVWEPIPDGAIERSLRSMTALALLAGWATVIYHFGPATRSRLRHDLPGALVAAVLWWLLAASFGFYEELTSRANDVTAAVGALILALTWVWLAAQVLLIGGTVNLLYAQRRDIARIRPSWTDLIVRSTGELRRIVVNNGGSDATEDPPVPGRRPPANQTTPLSGPELPPLERTEGSADDGRRSSGARR
jgi:membrane protein